MPMSYHVSWEIDIASAENPVDAARQAWEAMRREGSIANVFMVQEEDTAEAIKVDLTEVDEDGACRTCGQHYEDGGDGYDGECPDCADKTSAAMDEDENRQIMENAGWRRATEAELVAGFKPFQNRHGGASDADSWTALLEST